jgi:hypothetical protein
MSLESVEQNLLFAIRREFRHLSVLRGGSQTSHGSSRMYFPKEDSPDSTASKVLTFLSPANRMVTDANPYPRAYPRELGRVLTGCEGIRRSAEVVIL